MSIYPEGVDRKSLRYKFQVAAVDVPVPSDLGYDDATQWKNYLECCSPSQRIQKYGAALDEFHALLDKSGPDPLKLPESEQAVLYSKWYAASIADCVLAQNTRFMTERMYRDQKMFNSDMDMGLYCLVDLLKNLQSPDLQAWEDRRAKHNAIDDKTLLPLLNKFHAYNGKQSPKTSAPGP